VEKSQGWENRAKFKGLKALANLWKSMAMSFNKGSDKKPRGGQNRTIGCFYGRRAV